MCDTVVRIDSGRVLFAKNSDRDPNEAQVVELHRGGDHDPSERVLCTWVNVAQAPRTLDVMISRPFWMWGAEMGANEAGVVIGNEAVFTDQPYSREGLTGMDLVRLALERATTAAEAAEVIVDLIAAYGQGGGCGLEHRGFTYHSSFLIADAAGALVLETAGELTAVETVSSGVRAVSNGLTVAGFAEAHADRDADAIGRCHERRALTESGALAGRGPADMARVLRAHEGGAAEPQYREISGALGGPCVHAGGSAVASQTTASWISEISPDGARHWATGTAAPCTGLFVPVEMSAPPLVEPTPDETFNDETRWWRHELLHRRVARDPELLELYSAERDQLESSWFHSEVAAVDAMREAESSRARWTAMVAERHDIAPVDRRSGFVADYWRKRDERARVELPPAVHVPTVFID